MTRTLDDGLARRWHRAGVLLGGWLVAAAVPVAAAPPGGQPPGVVLELASTGAREAPAHRLRIEVAAGDPEITRAALTYPAGFAIRGFAAAGAIVGAFEVDANGDGTADRRAPVRALGPFAAFADVVGNGALDAGLEPRITIAGNALDIHLPFGDGDPSTTTAPVAARVSLVLSPGVIVSPALGGRYVVAGRIGADAAGGAARDVALPIDIDGPRLVRFAALAIDGIDVDARPGTDGRLRVRGRFVLSKASDGIDLRRELVVVAAGPFRQTLPGHAFRPTGHAFLYKGPASGIRSFVLRRDGRFEIEATGVRWPPDTPKPRHLTFELRIGNDLGETALVPDRPGHRFPR